MAAVSVAPRPPADDATAGGADALRAAARQGPAADRAQTGVWWRTYVSRHDFRREAGGDSRRNRRGR